MAALSQFIGGGIPSYIEFGWVTSPDAARQVVGSTGVILSCTNIVQNTANLAGVSISNPNFTIPSGTYYFEAFTSAMFNGTWDGIVSLYNVTNTKYEQSARGTLGSYGMRFNLAGQLALPASTTFNLRMIAHSTSYVGSANNGDNAITNSTAGADQRTAIKFWKLK